MKILLAISYKFVMPLKFNLGCLFKIECYYIKEKKITMKNRDFLTFVSVLIVNFIYILQIS